MFSVDVCFVDYVGSGGMAKDRGDARLASDVVCTSFGNVYFSDLASIVSRGKRSLGLLSLPGGRLLLFIECSGCKYGSYVGCMMGKVGGEGLRPDMYFLVTRIPVVSLRIVRHVRELGNTCQLSSFSVSFSSTLAPCVFRVGRGKRMYRLCVPHRRGPGTFSQCLEGFRRDEGRLRSLIG